MSKSWAAPPWTAEEDAVLRSSYARRGPKWCALATGRTRGAVITRAYKLAITRRRPVRAWTTGEVRTLREDYKRHGARYCADELCRPIKAVYNRAYLLGLTKRER